MVQSTCFEAQLLSPDEGCVFLVVSWCQLHKTIADMNFVYALPRVNWKHLPPGQAKRLSPVLQSTGMLFLQ
jgi:hypothetical protein